MKTILKIIIAVCLTISILNARDALLVDTSGSMNQTEVKKSIKKIVKSYLNTANEVLAFNDDVYNVTNENDLIFDGGTALANAMNHIYSLDVEYVVIVTDGIPEDEKETLEASIKLQSKNVKVCGVFLSNNDTEVPNILSQISDQIFVTNEIDQVFSLCSSSVKETLLGMLAKQKRVNAHRFDF